MNPAGEGPATPDPAPHAGRALPQMRRVDLAVLLVILAVTGGARFIRLGAPGAVLKSDHNDCKLIRGAVCYELIPLDERHYVPDARDVLEFGTESDDRISERDRALGTSDGAFVVHPPVGKWFIAAGIAIFGDDPFGWRFFGALFGTLGVLVVYLIGRRFWRSPWAAASAALLLGVEGLWFVQSRVAMLDIYAAFFVLLGFWLLLVDKDRTVDRGARPALIGAAVAFGLAGASKWSVAPFWAAAVLLAVGWEAARSGGIALGRLAVRTAAVAALLVAVPAGVYVATYTPWFLDAHRYTPCKDTADPFTQWRCYQGQMLSFHRRLEKFEAAGDGSSTSLAPVPVRGTTPTRAQSSEPGHPYFGEAWSWPWIGRPVVHEFEQRCVAPRPDDPKRCLPGGEESTEVIGIPNPVVWWPGFFVALPAVGWWALRRDGVALPIAAMFAAGFVPYLLADAVGRPVFLFYALPLVPFLVLALTHAGVRAVERWPASIWLAGALLAAAVLSFAYFYPVLAGLPIPRNGVFGWIGRMWFRADCTKVGVIKKACWI